MTERLNYHSCVRLVFLGKERVYLLLGAPQSLCSGLKEDSRRRVETTGRELRDCPHFVQGR